MIGSTTSHYKILEKLGEGGMGIVYKATDTKLNRTVALKFLPDRVQKDADAKARFLQEAQAAAALNHPNICTIHGVEDVDGSLFMVMEYVEGGTLREKLPFKKMDDAITVATQIGEALQEAHSKGIVHRDVKADNIMLTARGQAKVMDFGLAKLKGALKLTRTSSTVGTLGYMAPEQIQGGEVDHRSDIFSFGVLLFEMLTGKLPFRGEHEAAMVYSIVNEEPQSISTLEPEVSPIVDNLIQRCLEKDPAERYQHFDDIVADLKRAQKKTSRVTRSSAMPVNSPVKTRPSKNLFLYGAIGLAAIAVIAVFLTFRPSQNETPSGKEVPAIRTLAVLPMENIGGVEENEFFSDGMTEDITSQIAKVNGIKVVSRTSAMRYKASTKSLKEIAAELGASVVLEGSVQRSGETVRIVCRLIDAKTDNNIWTEKYDRDLKDIFAIQSEVAQRVAAALSIQLSSAAAAGLEQKPTENLDAYDLYLKGRYEWRKRNAAALAKATQYFRQAIRLDSDYALAYTGLADCLSLYRLYFVPGGQPERDFGEAELMARKAIALDPNLAEAHAALGVILKEWKWDWYESERELRKAIELDPNYASAYQWTAEVLAILGHNDEELAMAGKAAELEPGSPVILNILGMAFKHSGRDSDAIVMYQKSIELQPDFFYAHLNLLGEYIKTGNFEKALAEKQFLFSTGSPVFVVDALIDHAKTGVRPTLAELRRMEEGLPGWIRAANLVGLGYVDEAFSTIEEALPSRDGQIPVMLRTGLFRRYESDPRYKALSRKMGIREEDL